MTFHGKKSKQRLEEQFSSESPEKIIPFNYNIKNTLYLFFETKKKHDFALVTLDIPTFLKIL